VKDDAKAVQVLPVVVQYVVVEAEVQSPSLKKIMNI